MSFEVACQKAVDTQVTLILTEDVTLSETIKLKNEQRLHIQGQRDGDDDQGLRRVKIKGDLHSLFLLNNKSQLILECTFNLVACDEITEWWFDAYLGNCYRINI